MILLKTAIKGGLGWQIHLFADSAAKEELGYDPIPGATAIQSFRIIASIVE
jgi:hypothetical protein